MERSIVREKPRRTSGQNRQLKLLLFTAVCIVLIALAAYFFLWPKEEVFYLANFTYGEVELRDFHSWVNSAGKMSPKKLLDISIPFEGIIEKWVVEPGQPVEKDDILLSINGQALYEKIEETREKVADYEKRLKRFKIEEGYELLQREQEEKVHSNRIEKAQEHLDLTEELYKLDLVALNDFSSAKDSLEVALGEYERYKMNRELRDIQQENSRQDQEKMYLQARKELKALEELALELFVKAPSSGYILEQRVEAGDEFRKDQTLANFVTDEGLEYVGEIDHKDSRMVKVGQEAIIKELGDDIPALVTSVSPIVNEGRNTVTITLYPQEQEGLRSNVNAMAMIKIDYDPQRLSLPRAPYLASGGRLFVYLLDGENQKAYQHDVFFGNSEGNYIVVERGLELGDKIITSSYEDFKGFKEIDINPEGGRRYD